MLAVGEYQLSMPLTMSVAATVPVRRAVTAKV